MSSRRSLYRTNRSHTSLYGPRTDTSVTHWRLDFVSINTTRDEDAPADQPQKTHSFQVKTWVQISDSVFKPVEDGVEDDLLPFVRHTHTDGDVGLIGSHEASEPPSDAPKTDTNGITTSGSADSSRLATGTVTPMPETAEGTPQTTPAVDTPLDSSADGADSDRLSTEPASTEPASTEPASTEPASTVPTAPASTADSAPATETSSAEEATAPGSSTDSPAAPGAPDAASTGGKDPAAGTENQPEGVSEEVAAEIAVEKEPTVTVSDTADTDVKADKGATDEDVAMPDAE